MARMIVHFSIILCLSLSRQYSRGSHLEGKIVEGEYVKINNYPHAVFLEMSNGDGDPTHICGSSVLNQYYLLSVAHCFYSLPRNGKILAFAGHENIKKAKVIRTARLPIIHSKFNSHTIENDIALVLLKQPLPLGEHIQRIIIKRNFPRGVTGSIAGWGVINEITKEETMLLKSVKQTLKGKRVCFQLGLRPGMLCAGSLVTSDPRPTVGDSGSGLVTKAFQLIGLLSYKLQMFSALPVYTNVSYYYNWIRQKTQSKFCFG